MFQLSAGISPKVVIAALSWTFDILSIVLCRVLQGSTGHKGLSAWGLT